MHALHVHHGLSARADDWLAHCEAQCRAWAAEGWPIAFHACRLRLAPARGASVEALARSARYAALRRMAVAAGIDLVLLAHHRRDQAETWLLQALRGAGAAGLAAMPGCIERDGLRWARPWLGRPREAIDAYVRRHQLAWVEDDSNADPRLARNRLRLAVWPALVAAYPDAEHALADAAAHAQQAAACLADLAALDLAACAGDAALDLGAWALLAPHRRGNALRAWLATQCGRAPSAAELERLGAELPAGGAPAHWVLQGGAVLHRYRGRLRLEPAAAPAPAAAEDALSVRRAGRYRLPGWGGVLVAERVAEGGIALALLAALRLRPRAGGERLRLAPGRPSRSLKQHYQALAVPAWARGGPLLYSGDTLLFVPALGADAAALAPPGAPQLALRWEAAVAAAGRDAAAPG